jgi:hypothetical protein
MVDRLRLLTCCFLASTAGAASLAGQTIAGCAIFPSNNVWNTPVDHLRVDSNSAAYVAAIGTAHHLHPDFSSSGGGIPFVVVPGSQPKVPIVFGAGAAESDPGPYPVPPTAPVEAADGHVLVVENTNCILYEMYGAVKQASGSWKASSGAVFDLKSNQLRPAGWTSADAAGLPILPGLVRYDEVASGAINHAIRMTAPHTRREYIWPARHRASSLTGAQYPPMGQRFRLKASFDITPYPPDVQVILTALKKYGAILADNGTAWYLTGAPDPRWNDDTLHKLQQVFGSSMEAVDESSLMVDPNSAAVLSGTSALHSVQLNPAAVTTGATTTKHTVVLSAPAPSSGITVFLSSSNMAAASLPASVLVPGGATTASFTIQAGSVAIATPVTITAFYLGVSKTAVLTVNPIGIASLTLTPTSVTGGASASGVVTLTGAAPPSGLTVALASSNPLAATVPASLTIAPGAQSATFPIASKSQTTDSSSQINAGYGSTSARATLTVLAPVAASILTSVVLSPRQIQGGSVTNGYIWLSGPAPEGGVTLTVKSSNPLVTLTASHWLIPAGSSLKYMTVTAPRVTSPTTATISATANGITRSAVLTITPATIIGLALSAPAVAGGSTVTGTVYLGGTAAAGGTVVSVSSSSPAVAWAPTSVTVPAGKETVTFVIHTGHVTSASNVVITIVQGTSSMLARLIVHP